MAWAWPIDWAGLVHAGRLPRMFLDQMKERILVRATGIFWRGIPHELSYSTSLLYFFPFGTGGRFYFFVEEWGPGMWDE
jgi:hypothetical protein